MTIIILKYVNTDNYSNNWFLKELMKELTKQQNIVKDTTIFLRAVTVYIYIYIYKLKIWWIFIVINMNTMNNVKINWIR